MQPGLGRCLAGVTVALLALAPFGGAQAAVTQIDVSQAGQTLTNPCNGDTIPLTGAEHFVISRTQDKSGGQHVMQHVNGQAIGGIGIPSGLAYHVQDDVHATLNLNPGVIAATMRFAVRFVTQQPGATFVLDQAEHLTIAPDGSVVVDHLDPFAAACQ